MDDTEPFQPIIIEVETIEELACIVHALGAASDWSVKEEAEGLDANPPNMKGVSFRLYTKLKVEYRKFVKAK